MNAYQLTYKPYGDKAVLIEWQAKIDEQILHDILAFKQAILKNNPNVEVVNAYSSLTIIFPFVIADFHAKVEQLKAQYADLTSIENPTTTLWKIPVCYDAKFGIDLHEMSKAIHIPEKEIIQLHTQQQYTIYFTGFLPGFLYLGGLNQALHIPRKTNPRLNVLKGAVGIGGAQTGIYPQQSAGGWNIIGNSPIDFFDRKKPQPCFAKAGDKIQFVSIDLAEHKNISYRVAYKRFKIEREVLNA